MDGSCRCTTPRRDVLGAADDDDAKATTTTASSSASSSSGERRTPQGDQAYQTHVVNVGSASSAPPAPPPSKALPPPPAPAAAASPPNVLQVSPHQRCLLSPHITSPAPPSYHQPWAPMCARQDLSDRIKGMVSPGSSADQQAEAKLDA